MIITDAGNSTSVIEGILPRRTAIVRRRAGKPVRPQVLAANINRVLLVTSMDQDFSVRRLERYLTLVWESGATPIIALTKSDLVNDTGTFRRQAETCALGFPVLCLSCVSGEGMQELFSLLLKGETIVLLGSSGVGKSTLINALAGTDLRATRPVREKDGTGRHATTDRHLLRLPSEVLLIDTPGLREVQLWADEASVSHTFPEISAFAVNCRFRDCTHLSEPGCAVIAAIERGEIEFTRFESFHRLKREVEHLKRQDDTLVAMRYKRNLRRMMRAYETMYRHRAKP